jgi:imidazolonepropionase
MADQDTLIVHNTSEVATADATGLRVIRIPRGAVAERAGLILDLGDNDELLRRYPGATLIDAAQSLVTPGLIDCHTHLLFAGQRAREFQRRLAGESYASIAAAGGGIRATQQATAAASDEALEASLAGRIARWLSAGCTTVEVKSGYGLTVDGERRLLALMTRVAGRAVVRVARTALLLHALPVESRSRRKEYVMAMAALLPDIRRDGLATAVDVYCDAVAFTVQECRTLLRAAQAAGLAVKLHAEQFTRTGGAQLAAELHARSADHLESATDDDWHALATAHVVGVLLPVAALSLGQRLPAAEQLRQAGTRVAIATDFNPGSSATQSLLECAALGARLCGFTAEESLLAVTWNAARALGVEHDTGHLTPGLRADLVVWDCAELEELTYWMPAVSARNVIVGGAVVAGMTTGKEH